MAGPARCFHTLAVGGRGGGALLPRRGAILCALAKLVATTQVPLSAAHVSAQGPHAVVGHRDA